MYQNPNYFSNNYLTQQPTQNGYISQPNISSSKIARSVSNNNLANLNVVERISAPQEVHVEYEMAVPLQIRHTPYHSLWNLHQW